MMFYLGLGVVVCGLSEIVLNPMNQSNNQSSANFVVFSPVEFWVLLNISGPSDAYKLSVEWFILPSGTGLSIMFFCPCHFLSQNMFWFLMYLNWLRWCYPSPSPITSQNCVKVLGVSIDKHLTFNDHISSSCSKAARQLNAFARISKHLNLDSRRVIHQSFILSNFNYCPLVWHFCGKTNNKKLEKIQERSLRILYNDYDSTYEDLLCNNISSTLLLSRLKTLLLETFKSLRHTNAECLHDIFNPKMSPYDLRTTNIEQPKKEHNHSRVKIVLVSRISTVE